ncbi:hypothetical protein Tco_1103935 [Tanacetum coccineum]
MWCRPALIDKSGMIACFDSIILHDLERLDVELCVRGSGGYWASMRIESNLMLQIKEAQRDDVEALLCVPNDQALREKVMTEAHSSPFTIHPGLEVGLIRRIQGLDTAYWGFLGVGTTLAIFQNIILIPYFQYGVLVFWIRRIELYSSMVFGECRHGYAVSSLMDTAYWSSE